MQKSKLNRINKFVKNPHRAVWQLAIPIMAGMSIQIIYGLVDMAFIGRIGGDALAAISFNMPLVFLFMGITFGLGTGVTSVIAQFLGKNDKKSANNVAEHSILIAIVLGIIIPIFSVFFADNIFLLLGAPPHILPLAVTYFKIIAIGFVFNILNIFFKSIMTGEGDTKTPMFFRTIGTVINLILDPVLIFGLKLGIAGAALATITGQFAVTLIFIYYILIKKKTYIKFNFSYFKFSTNIITKILKVGVPASISMILMSFSVMIYNRLLITFGSNAVAGYGISRNIIQIYFLPILALSNSMITLTGMFYGRKEI
ncbi:MAG: MATE family efflux transporter, partial [Candidatus Marinimicrobia bacterium]|nr:MATE family efflux transporter [Candidatus Neomarinimicrobiota bacterium]